jgi:hypothetical protein
VLKRYIRLQEVYSVLTSAFLEKYGNGWFIEKRIPQSLLIERDFQPGW